MAHTPDPQLVALARRLAADGTAKRIREHARLSLRDVASALDVADSTVCRWENGVRLPRGESAIRWARMLSNIAEVAEAPAAETAEESGFELSMDELLVGVQRLAGADS